MEALEKENRELKRKLESISHGRSSAKPEQEVSAFRSELPELKQEHEIIREENAAKNEIRKS